MRDLLTGIAIIVIVALTTLLVAPYFVDWNGQRGFLEAQMSRAFGQKVTIGGKIDLRLLPTPYLRLNQTVIGSDDGPVRVGVRHLDLELSAAPLLYGEFDVVEGRFDEPTVRVTLGPDRTLPTLPQTPAFRADVRLERVTVANGTLAVADPESGRTFVADHIDFTAEAPSVFGPFKAQGSEGDGAARTKFRLSTTEPKKGRTHVHFALDQTAVHPGLDLDGELTLAAAGSDKTRQSFEGAVVATGQLPGTGENGPLAWRLAGPLKADPQTTSLTGGELSLGGEDRNIVLQVGGVADFRDLASLHVELAAKQLDIDRLSGAPADTTKPPPPPRLPRLTNLQRIWAAVVPSWSTTVDVRIDNATWGGETLSGLVAHLGLGGAAPQRVELAGDGPGALHLAVNGALLPNRGYDGRFELGVDDAPEAVRWLDKVAPDLGFSARDVPARNIRVAGALKTDATGLTLDRLNLRLGRSMLAGTVRVTAGNSTSPATVTADMRTAALQLDTLPDLSRLRRSGLPIDLNLKLDAGSVKIARIGDGPLAAGRVQLDLAAAGSGVTVNNLSAADLGGATIKASGTFDRGTATGALTVDAAHLEQAAALLRQLAPGDVANGLADRAASLAPAKLRIAGSFAAGAGGGTMTPTKLEVTGTLAATRVAVRLVPASDGAGVALNASATAPEAGSLLRQLGFDALSLDLVGNSRIDLTANGTLDRPLATKLDAVFGASRLSISGQFKAFGASRGGSGTVTLQSPGTAPLLRVLALANPDLTAQWPADLSAGVAAGQNGIALSDIKGRLAEVGVAGTLKWQPPHNDDAVLTGALDLDHLALSSVLGVALGPGPPPPTGSPWSAEPFSARLLNLPRSAVTLHAKMLDLGFGLVGQDATLNFGSAPEAITLGQSSAHLAGGQIGGTLTLRRDGAQASLEAHLHSDAVVLDLPAIKGKLTGKLEIAGGGSSALALVSSFAGSGDATLANAVAPGADPQALAQVFAAVEDDSLTADDESVRRAFTGKGAGAHALDAGTRAFTLGLANGTLSLQPKDPPVVAGGVGASLGGTLDLRRIQLGINATETLNALPQDWRGPAPAVVVTQAGAPEQPRRSVDVSGFVNAVAARAIARESARIESYEFDVRERALFNARLQVDRRREQDRVKAEADATVAAADARRAAVDAMARKAEADRRARTEAVMQAQKLRHDEATGEAPTRPLPQRNAAPPPTSPDQPNFETPPPGVDTDPSAAGRY